MTEPIEQKFTTKAENLRGLPAIEAAASIIEAVAVGIEIAILAAAADGSWDEALAGDELEITVTIRRRGKST